MLDTYFTLNGAEKVRVPWSVRQRLTSFLIWFAGYVESILLQHCPAYEYSLAVAIGLVAVIGTVFNAGLLTIAGHALFGLHSSNLGIVVTAVIFALAIASLDSYAGRTQQIPDGVTGLRAGGLSFSPIGRYIRSLLPFAVYRGMITVLTALVITTGGGLLWFATDINARQNQIVLDGNHAIFQQAEQAYEQGTKRLSDAEMGQSALVADLEREDKRLRQEVVRRSVAITRRDLGAPSTVDKAQLEKFEKRLADEKSKLASLREQSLKRVEGRNAAVTQMIATSPEKAQRQDGVIGRLSTLHEILADNPGALVIVIAIDLLLALLDCAGFIVRLCAPTSVYAAYVAKIHIIESVGQAKDCADQLSRYERATRPDPDGNPPGATPLAGKPPAPPPPSNDNHARTNDNRPLRTIENSAAPPRRGRGRPRKNGLNGSTKEPPHEE